MLFIKNDLLCINDASFENMEYAIRQRYCKNREMKTLFKV